jgi:hypothetical protein
MDNVQDESLGRGQYFSGSRKNAENDAFNHFKKITKTGF